MPPKTTNPIDLSKYKVQPETAMASTTAPVDLSKYKLQNQPEAPKNNNNIAQDIIGGFIKSNVARPALRAIGALGLLGTSFASPETQRKVEEYVNKPQQINLGPFGGVQTVEPSPNVANKEGFKKIAGETVEAGINLLPSQAVTKTVGGVLAKTGIADLVPKFSTFLSKTAPLPTYGYGADVAENLQQENNQGSDFAPGAATAVTTGIASIPIIGRFLGGASKMGAGFSTGVGENVIQEAFDASREGGKRLKDFQEVMRSQGGEEKLVTEAKEALDVMKASKTSAYKSAMQDVYKNSPFKPEEVKPILDTVRKGLEDFKVNIGADGNLDFSRSALRFNREGQADIENIYKTLADFGTKPEDFTVESIDNLKQAIGDLYSKSGKARAFVQSVKSSARNVLSKAKGYDEMAGNYEEATNLIDDITRGLSLGDKVQTDTAFRKLATTLRTNNEVRKQFVDALNDVGNGNLTSKIAGQQLSSKLPRGLVGQLGAGGSALMALNGLALVKFLPILAASSPRLVGEVVSILGRAMGGVDNVFKALEKAGATVPKTPGDIFNQKPLDTARSSAMVSTNQTKPTAMSDLTMMSKSDSIPETIQDSVKNVNTDVKKNFSDEVSEGNFGNKDLYEKSYVDFIEKNRRSAKPFNYDVMEMVGSKPEIKGDKVKVYRMSVGGSKDLVDGDNVSIYDFRKLSPETQRKMGVEDVVNNKDAKMVETWINKDELYQTDAGTQLYKPSKAVSSLEQEAKKYKSAEEFVKAQGTPVYHGTKNNLDIENISAQPESRGQYLGNGIYFTKYKEGADLYGGKSIEATVNDADFLDISKLNGVERTKEIGSFGTYKQFLKNNNLEDTPTSFDKWKFNQQKVADKIIEMGYKGVTDGQQHVIFDKSALKTKSQLTDIWNKANSNQEKQLRGFATPKALATAGGASALPFALDKLGREAGLGTESYTRTAETTPEFNVDKAVEAIAYNETRGEDKPYSYSRFSGSEKQGDALGKYQVTEGELKTYGERYLGEVPTKEEFLESPEMQEEYMRNKLEYLYYNENLSIPEIFAVHRGGITNPEENLTKYKKYVDDAISIYEGKTSKEE